MWKKYTPFVFACAITLVAASCSKEMAPAPEARVSGSTQVVNATITPEGTYTLSFDKAVQVGIKKQAAHFRESATSVNNETGQTIYSYSPITGFNGDDEVTLSKTVKIRASSYNGSSSMGQCGNSSAQSYEDTYQQSFVTVKIKVTK